MKFTAVIFSVCLAVLACCGQDWPAGNASVISRSGQFIIYGGDPASQRSFAPASVNNPALIQMQPSLLAVSCERIKHTLLRALNVRDEWRGKIFVVLHPFRNTNEDIVVTSTQYSDGWNYRMDLPDAIESPRLVRAVTQVLLVEMANRKANTQSAQLPPWLAEGLPQYLLASSDLDLVLQPGQSRGGGMPVRTVAREGRLADPFEQARTRLRNHAPLNIEELSLLPEAEEMRGAAGEIFRSSALLFVRELLKLPKGGESLYAMLPELPWDPDWRVGFLRAFHSQFPRAVDLEKWWVLQSAYFAGRDAKQAWTRAESLTKLNEALRSSIEVRLDTNSPPFRTDVSLQAIIKGWEIPRQTQALREKAMLLELTQLRIAPELTPLLMQYREILASYLKKMGMTDSKPPSQSLPGFGRHAITVKMQKTGVPAADNPNVQETLAQLDVLDVRREAWKTVPEAAQ